MTAKTCNCNGYSNGNQVQQEPGQLQLIANPGRHDRNLGVPEGRKDRYELRIAIERQGLRVLD
jgi:hypothetical protein